VRIALDVQHAGKPDRPDDRGASAFGVEEVSLTRSWLDHIDRELRKLGHQVLPISDGAYPERWARADDWGADVYVALHANAGGGARGEVFYDHRSARGAGLAAAVADALEGALRWKVEEKPCRADDDGQARDEDYSEAFACIRGVRAVALVLEPGFIDGPVEHRTKLRDGALIGSAVARGIAAWAA
jgi:N-acetylmuramoyl-L-alanine amidase